MDAHVDAHRRAETGDWRAAVDGLRPVTAQLWQGLDDEDKRAFLADHARTWERAPAPDAAGAPPAGWRRSPTTGRLVRHPGTLVTPAQAVNNGVEVTLADGRRVVSPAS